MTGKEKNNYLNLRLLIRNELANNGFKFKETEEGSFIGFTVDGYKLVIMPRKNIINLCWFEKQPSNRLATIKFEIDIKNYEEILELFIAILTEFLNKDFKNINNNNIDEKIRSIISQYNLYNIDLVVKGDDGEKREEIIKSIKGTYKEEKLSREDILNRMDQAIDNNDAISYNRYQKMLDESILFKYLKNFNDFILSYQIFLFLT